MIERRNTSTATAHLCLHDNKDAAMFTNTTLFYFLQGALINRLE